MTATAIATAPASAAVATARSRGKPLALGALLGATALLYLWGLSNSGWANQYYAAAAQSGSKSWKAFLFGSLDQSNFITVDKPPASLWVMDLSVKLFGVNSWSILRFCTPRYGGSRRRLPGCSPARSSPPHRWRR